MSDRLRRFEQDWLPPRLRRALTEYRVRRLLNDPLPPSMARILGGNRDLQGAYAGRRCFVLGNGPSLKQHDIAPLADEVTIVMNSFNRHSILGDWQPTVYCRAEPGGSYDSTERGRTIEQYTRNVRARHYVFPYSATTAVHKFGGPLRGRVYFVHLGVDLRYWPADRTELDLCLTMPQAGNTGHLAVMLALCMGCSPIYLDGFDHDWLAHRSVNRHFYAASNDEVGGADDFATYRYKDMMEQSIREWQRYEKLKTIADARNVPIINLTEGGFLDVFPIDDYRRVVGAPALKPTGADSPDPSDSEFVSRERGATAPSIAVR